MCFFPSSLGNGLCVIALKFMKCNCHNTGKHQPSHILQANKQHFDRKTAYCRTASSLTAGTGSAHCSDSCSPLCRASGCASDVGLVVCFMTVLWKLLPLPEQPLFPDLVCTYLLLGHFPGRAEPEPRGGNRVGIRSSTVSGYVQSLIVSFQRGAGPAHCRPFSAVSSPQLPPAHSGLPKPDAKRDPVLPSALLVRLCSAGRSPRRANQAGGQPAPRTLPNRGGMRRGRSLGRRLLPPGGAALPAKE